MAKTYVRDYRSPKPKSESVSRVMSANKGRSTGPEVQLRQALRKAGLTGYRVNWKGVPGRPDIAFPRKKVAVFVNGCFWHRCPHCMLPLPKSNAEYWKAKFEANVERDRRKNEALKELGWTVVTCWECEIEKDIEGCVGRIMGSFKR